MVRTRFPMGGSVTAPPPPPVVPAAPVLPPAAVVPPGRVVPPAPGLPPTVVIPAPGAPPRPEPAVIPPEAAVSPPESAPPGAPAPPARTPPPPGDGCVLPPAVVCPPSLVAPPAVVPPAPAPPPWVPPTVPDDVLFPLQPSANGVPSSSTRTNGRALWIIFMTSPANDDVPVECSVLLCDAPQPNSKTPRAQCTSVGFATGLAVAAIPSP